MRFLLVNILLLYPGLKEIKASMKETESGGNGKRLNVPIISSKSHKFNQKSVQRRRMSLQRKMKPLSTREETPEHNNPKEKTDNLNMKTQTLQNRIKGIWKSIQLSFFTNINRKCHQMIKKGVQSQRKSHRPSKSPVALDNNVELNASFSSDLEKEDELRCKPFTHQISPVVDVESKNLELSDNSPAGFGCSPVP